VYTDCIRTGSNDQQPSNSEDDPFHSSRDYENLYFTMNGDYIAVSYIGPGAAAGGGS